MLFNIFKSCSTSYLNDYSAEKCRRLREDGGLKLMALQLRIAILGKVEPYYIREIAEEYRRESKTRNRLWTIVMHIVSKTAENDNEMEIVHILQTIQAYTMNIYEKCSIDCRYRPDCRRFPAVPLRRLIGILNNDPNLLSFTELLGGVTFVLELLQTDYVFHNDDCLEEGCAPLRHSALEYLGKLSIVDTTDGIKPNHEILDMIQLCEQFVTIAMNLLQFHQNNQPLIQSCATILGYLAMTTDLSEDIEDQGCARLLFKIAMNAENMETRRILITCSGYLLFDSEEALDDVSSIPGVFKFLYSLLNQPTISEQASELVNRLYRTYSTLPAMINENAENMENQDPKYSKATELSSVVIRMLKSEEIPLINAAINILNSVILNMRRERKMFKKLSGRAALRKLREHPDLNLRAEISKLVDDPRLQAKKASK